jgi:hypothetical protein
VRASVDPSAMLSARYVASYILSMELLEGITDEGALDHPRISPGPCLHRSGAVPKEEQSCTGLEMGLSGYKDDLQIWSFLSPNHDIHNDTDLLR